MKVDRYSFEIVRGSTKSSVDAYIQSGYDLVLDRELDDEELDKLTDLYSAEIQAYAVEQLGCYWE
jgi:hypothetical protein